MNHDLDPDFNALAAPPTTLDPDFNRLMLPKKPGRPKKSPPNPHHPLINNNNNIYIYNENNMVNDSNAILLNDIDNKEVIKLTDKLTKQELCFLELYFNMPRFKGKDLITINKAMLLAGYGNYPENTRYVLAKKIVKKYERAAPDARKVFQDLGFGQVRVAQGIIDKAETARSEQVSLKALMYAGDCQGMRQETRESYQGINIVINTAPPPSQAPCPGPPGPDGAPARPEPVVISTVADAPAARPLKPLQITR